MSSWKCDTDQLPEISIDASCLPLVAANGKNILRLFWFDAFEDHVKQPGIVFLFGKVWANSAKQHVSCCVSVRNVERCIYFLPRPHRVNIKTNSEDLSRPVTFLDVYQVYNVYTDYKRNDPNHKSSNRKAHINMHSM